MFDMPPLQHFPYRASLGWGGASCRGFRLNTGGLGEQGGGERTRGYSGWMVLLYANLTWEKWGIQSLKHGIWSPQKVGLDGDWQRFGFQTQVRGFDCELKIGGFVITATRRRSAWSTARPTSCLFLSGAAIHLLLHCSWF